LKTTKKSFTPEPFTPHPKLKGPNAQSISGAYLRNGRGVTFRRERLELPDGDFLDLDFPSVRNFTWQNQDGTPVVLVLHGLEGSAQSSYMFETYRQLAQRGLRSIGVNFRSCSGELNRLPRLYHSGETEDLSLVLRVLQARFPSIPLFAVGFSLGANVLLKYLGEQGEKAPVHAAAVVSPPFDLAAGAHVMEHGWGRVYLGEFLRRLRRKVRAKKALLQDLIDFNGAISARTFHEFDGAATAPLHGFKDAEDYYTRCSSNQFIPKIRVPTLMLRALDDPFFTPTDIPHKAIDTNPCVQAVFTETGGHVGFVEPSGFWAERQVARFLGEQVVN